MHTVPFVVDNSAGGCVTPLFSAEARERLDRITAACSLAAEMKRAGKSVSEIREAVAKQRR